MADFDEPAPEWGATGVGATTSTGDSTGPDPVPAEIADLVTDETGTLAVAYGKHVVRGNLILNKRSAGPPPNSIIYVALGEGTWDGVEAIYYANELIAGANYHFHPGNFAVSNADPTQGIDSYLPSGLTYSGTAYIAVTLPEKYATEDRPDKLVGIYRCLKVKNYDEHGNVLDTGSYSSNPARCAAHAVIERGGFTIARIHWPSWCRFRDWCDVSLSWDDDGDTGTAPISLKRAECHAVFLGETDVATALDTICATAGATWQDDGERIRFILPTDQTPVFHFNDGTVEREPVNIVNGSFKFSSRELKERPNKIRAEFRNILDEFLFPSTEGAERELLQDRVGLVDPGSRQFASMTYSQAQRLLERQMRIETDNPIIAELTGQGDSFALLPGDYVEVSHAVAGWTRVPCIVVEVTDRSFEQTADERAFILQRIEGILYSDADHRPIQVQATP